jgi:hypothetical protein
VDTSVLNFLRQFHQNSLFRNVNLLLHLEIEEEMDTLLTTMSDVLPLIRDNINSIQLVSLSQCLIYNANSDMAMDMLMMSRILQLR